MYPKVKVRNLEADDQYAYERSSVQSLKAFESLSIHDFSSPVKEWEDDFPSSIVRIPGSNISNSDVPTGPASKGAANNKNKEVVEDNKPNIKASSVLRPRAVLSSPDNDGMIASTNRTRELHSGMKNQNMCQNRHTQCKVTPGPIVFGSPIDTRRLPNEAADGSRKGLQGKRGPSIGDQNQRSYTFGKRNFNMFKIKHSIV